MRGACVPTVAKIRMFCCVVCEKLPWRGAVQHVYPMNCPKVRACGAGSQLQPLCDQTHVANTFSCECFPRAAAVVDRADLLGRSACVGKEKGAGNPLGVDGIGGQVRTVSASGCCSLCFFLCRFAHASQPHVSHFTPSEAWLATIRACDDGSLRLSSMYPNVCDRSFFSKAPTEKASPATVSPGDQFLYQEDWGEKYTGVRFQRLTDIALKIVRNCEMLRKDRTAAALPSRSVARYRNMRLCTLRKRKAFWHLCRPLASTHCFGATPHRQGDRQGRCSQLKIHPSLSFQCGMQC